MLASAVLLFSPRVVTNFILFEIVCILKGLVDVVRLLRRKTNENVMEGE
jgi:hypothetical protein